MLSSITAPNKLRTKNDAYLATTSDVHARHATSTQPPTRRTTTTTHTYTVQWAAGTLGLVMKNTRNAVHIAEVGAAAHATSSDFQVDDKLVSINAFQVREMGFAQSIQLLQSVTKPVSLTFKRRVATVAATATAAPSV
ncbi:Aste57867_12591 [Aphanomyces stellatus]|uniref:Aste57867_12591 protein n=1 Tax=Aphanomyces stellatus TaxID=120398 RepID=A0A485KW00_9STRA|nr:hypothetical protein As57867_012545 [Aphanomyces stellatus]VFT89442.1 Aste57867_12591 [Aphanomyces stellatus]